MATSLAKINIHLIFHVKSTSVKVREGDLPRLFAYIGGIPDHVHILTTLPKMMAPADFVRTIKAESSKWLKTLAPHYASFAWQEGYGAFSVSPSLLNTVVRYIRRQAEHHRRRSFREEYKMFLEAYGIEYNERYAFED